MHGVFTIALFTLANVWKQPKCPWTGEWRKQVWYIRTVERYSATGKESTLFATWVALKGIMPREINQQKANTV